MTSDIKARDATICALYVDKGYGLRRLAADFKLSYERVRQIVKKGAPGKMRVPYYYDRGTGKG